jgi:hypothetical protein
MATIKHPTRDRMEELLLDAATKNADEVLNRLKTNLYGLTDEEAAERLEVLGPNEVTQERQQG